MLVLLWEEELHCGRDGGALKMKKRHRFSQAYCSAKRLGKNRSKDR
jgi:hypothetical protein